MVAPLWALNTIKKLCSLKKWTKVHQIFLGGCYSTKPLTNVTMQNFVAIGSKMPKISGQTDVMLAH